MEILGPSLSALPSFLAYFVVAVGETLIFTLIYVHCTAYREFALIRAGNTAAAIAFSGALLGFVLPLASVIAHSLHLPELAFWGVIAMVVQLGGYLLVRWVFPNLSAAIESNQTAQATFLAATSIAIGIVDAACMAG